MRKISISPYTLNKDQDYLEKKVSEMHKVEKKHNIYGKLINAGMITSFFGGFAYGMAELMASSNNNYNSLKDYFAAGGIILGGYAVGEILHKINDKSREKNLKSIDSYLQ